MGFKFSGFEQVAKDIERATRLARHLNVSKLEIMQRQLERSSVLASLAPHIALSQQHLRASETARLHMESAVGMAGTAAELARCIPRFDSWALDYQIQLQDLQNKVSKQFLDLVVTLPSETLRNTLASFKASLEVFSPSMEIFLEAQRFSDHYFGFSARQLEKMNVSGPRAGVAAVVLDSAGEMFQQSSDLFQTFLADVEYEEEDDLESSFEIRHHNVFSTLNRHLAHLYGAQELPEDLEDRILGTVPVRIHAAGCCLIESIYDLNTYVQASGAAEIFRATTKGVYAASRVPNVIAGNEKNFAEIVDHLYFMLYEGSGDAKRLLLISSGVDCGPLWRLKHLRRNFRHDVEHGSPREVGKKLREAGVAFEVLIGVARPRCVLDWKRAQLALYEDLKRMLDAIYERLTVEDPTVES